MFPVEQRWRPFEETRERDLNDRHRRRRRRTLARGQRRHPRLPARRARDPRGRRPPAQAPRARPAAPARANPAAVRAPVAGRAGPRLRAARRAAHRARHQRRRDLADRARHPLRHRRRPGARQALQLPQQGRAVADRADQPGGGEPARRPLRPRRRRHLHPPLRREGLRRPAALHRPGNPALVAGRRDPAHEVARASARSRTFRSSSRRRGKAIADGYALLGELGAVDDDNELTPIGRELAQPAARPARRPHDPRGARAPVADRGADHRRGAVSVQDVRDRPLEQQQAADDKHKPFDDEKSEFIGTLKLWHWIEEGRGSHGHEHSGDTTSSSNRQQEQRLRDHFISAAPRARVARHPFATADRRRRARLAAEHRAGHLRADASGAARRPARQHRPARPTTTTSTSARAASASGATRARTCRRSPAAGSMAAELVETTRLFGRGLAAIEPHWIERIGGHLLKKQLLEPHWEKKAAEVVALERATLYGVVIYSNRRVNFGRIDPAAAREIFIREALVAGEWETQAAVPGPQPQADRAGRGARTQVAAAGRAGRRRADLRLLRPAGAGRRAQRRDASSAGTARRSQRQPKLLHADARRADAPRGRRHHDAQPSRRRSAWAASTARRATCTSRAMPRTASP